MVSLALFVLPVAGLISIWSGQMAYVVLAAGVFIAAAVHDLIMVLSKGVTQYFSLRNIEMTQSMAKNSPVFMTMMEQAIREATRNRPVTPP